MTSSTLVGRKIFCENTVTVMEILSIEPPMKGMEDDGDMLKLRHLDTGRESVTNWVSEVGTEFYLLPVDFPQENIDKLHQYSQLRVEVANIVSGIIIE